LQRTAAGGGHRRGKNVLPLYYYRDMAIRKKRSISIPPELDAEITAAAAAEGKSYSAWLAETARREFTIRAGLAAVSEFEREHGPFSAAEVAEADRWAAQAVAGSGPQEDDPERRSA
jgi:hypothetical protein